MQALAVVSAASPYLFGAALMAGLVGIVLKVVHRGRESATSSVVFKLALGLGLLAALAYIGPLVVISLLAVPA